MKKCIICGCEVLGNDNFDTMCLKCFESYGFCELRKQNSCSGSGIVDKNLEKRYQFSFKMPSKFYNNSRFIAMDMSIQEQLQKINPRLYCCLECYKTACKDVVLSLYRQKDLSRIKFNYSLNKVEAPLFNDTEEKYRKYIENI